MEKCEWGRQEVKFLGHIISANGMRPDPDKTTAVLEMKASARFAVGAMAAGSICVTFAHPDSTMVCPDG